MPQFFDYGPVRPASLVIAITRLSSRGAAGFRLGQRMAAPNKDLARSNKSRTGFPATNKRRQRGAFLWRCQLAESPLRGLSAAGLLRPLAARVRAEAEHELSLFDCLRVRGYCIDRCYLVDPSFVRRHLAVN
jgi:hypothetical protein